MESVSWIEGPFKSHRTELRRAVFGNQDPWLLLEDMGFPNQVAFALLPNSVIPPLRGWKLAASDIPFFEEKCANVWLHWPEFSLWETDEKEFLEQVAKRKDDKEILEQEAKYSQQNRNDIVFKIAESEEDVQKVMVVLRLKFGQSGELWYDPSEICESFVRSSLFVYAESAEDGPVGCCGACSLKGTLYDVEIENCKTRAGWELTHYAVLGIKQGKYAGIAVAMQTILVNWIEKKFSVPQLIILDCT